VRTDDLLAWDAATDAAAQATSGSSSIDVNTAAGDEDEQGFGRSHGSILSCARRMPPQRGFAQG
jgi:hypothetical protein